MSTLGAVGSWAIATLEIFKHRMTTICLGRLCRGRGLDLRTSWLSFHLWFCVQNHDHSAPSFYSNPWFPSLDRPHIVQIRRASPGRNAIVLFWMRRKLIVLLQLLLFSSPHGERPAFVLMASNVGWACFSILCGTGRHESSWFLQESWNVRVGRPFRTNSDLSSCYSSEETENLGD